MSTDNAINYNFEVSSTPSRYLRAFIAYLKALENWNVEETLACFDDTLQHRILPASLGRPVRAKEAYAEFWRDVPQIFGGNKFVVTIHEVIESGHKLAVHVRNTSLEALDTSVFPITHATLFIQCSSKSLSARGTPYANEYSLFIHYVPLPAGVDPFAPLAEGENLPKMALVKEFVDSGLSSSFFAGEGATAVVNKGA